MAKKYYAVHKGRQPGVYDNWDECNAQVFGYQGAVFKSFSSEQDANDFYLFGVQADSKTEAKESVRSVDAKSVSDDFAVPDGPYVFVDGSFNPDTKVFGYGGFLVVDDKRIPIMGASEDLELASMRNVAGEIHGAMAAVKEAEKHGVRDLVILYDYKGIEEWASGNWKANKRGTADYAAFMNSDDRIVNVSFQKVAAHTGVPGNELADVMAKTAVGIKLTRSQQALFDSIDFDSDKVQHFLSSKQSSNVVFEM